jgi:hypothetical protein
MLLTLAIAAAEAGGLNHEPSFRVGLVYVPKADHRFGVEIGANYRYLLIDQCSRWPGHETTCYRGSIYPTGGPSALVSWTGGSRLSAFAGLVSGVSTADMHQFGFFPLWSVDLRVGVAAAVHEGVGLGLGAEVGRALGAKVVVDSGPDFTSWRTYGPLGLTLRVGALTRWTPGEGFAGSHADLAVETCTFAFDYL